MRFNVQRMSQRPYIYIGLNVSVYIKLYDIIAMYMHALTTGWLMAMRY